MSKVFGEYSKYYDEFYRTKDYVAECDYVEGLLRKFGRRKRGVLLDLGCGTAGHSVILARRGWKVHAIDRSPTMLKIARRKAREKGARINFHESDIRTFSLGEKADAAIAMFAVVSYLTTSEKLLQFFTNVARHLKPGASFIFDVWFGPGVLRDKPTNRLKVSNFRGKQILRFAESSLNLMDQTVEVKYRIWEIAKSALTRQYSEEHRMKYFFPTELSLLLKTAGFALVGIYPTFKIEGVPTEGDWSISIVARSLGPLSTTILRQH